MAEGLGSQPFFLKCHDFDAVSMRAMEIWCIWDFFANFVVEIGYIVLVNYMMKIVLDGYYFRKVFRANKFHSFHKWGRANTI